MPGSLRCEYQFYFGSVLNELVYMRTQRDQHRDLLNQIWKEKGDQEKDYELQIADYERECNRLRHRNKRLRLMIINLKKYGPLQQYMDIEIENRTASTEHRHRDIE